MTDLTPNDLSHLSDAEFHALCAQGEHAPGSEPLSPAAQAILAAWCDAHGWENEDIPPAVFHGLAAALRALADELVPEGGVFLSTASAARIRRDLLAIATELESTDEH